MQKHANVLSAMSLNASLQQQRLVTLRHGLGGVRSQQMLLEIEPPTGELGGGNDYRLRLGGDAKNRRTDFAATFSER
jgi:hypothetical protein